MCNSDDELSELMKDNEEYISNARKGLYKLAKSVNKYHELTLIVEKRQKQFSYQNPPRYEKTADDSADLVEVGGQ